MTDRISDSITFLRTIAYDSMGMEPGDRQQASEAADELTSLRAECYERETEIFQQLDYIERLEEWQKTNRSAIARASNAEADNEQLRAECGELREALKQYANRDQWEKLVPDSYRGEIDVFDWDGDLADEPWEFAERALSRQKALEGGSDK